MAKKDEGISVFMGRDPSTRRFNRNLAIAAREMVPATVMLEWLMAVMAGHGQAVVDRDASAPEGWVVKWPAKGELASTPAEKQWAWTQWRQAAYGMPAQQVQIENDIRVHASEISGIIDYNALPPGALSMIRATVRGVLEKVSADTESSDDENNE